ncbi:MAG: hypothetical protein ACFFC7_30595 [Candidatus Hermodarchaeota archaeon]
MQLKNNKKESQYIILAKPNILWKLMLILGILFMVYSIFLLQARQDVIGIEIIILMIGLSVLSLSFLLIYGKKYLIDVENKEFIVQNLFVFFPYSLAYYKSDDFTGATINWRHSKKVGSLTILTKTGVYYVITSSNLGKLVRIGKYLRDYFSVTVKISGSRFHSEITKKVL